ncbi:MAG: DUF2062 domain-containing protein [Nevskiaceae bacterium]|jgi:uncharacterized protein (DUF2062 family)|nr:DUF2062 domain-containing protein [Nevskiaceae bacterium]
MPRRFFIKLRPMGENIRHGWAARLIGPGLRDARLWALNRRAITSAVGAGVAIAFTPVPAHLLVGLLVAMIWRLNVPAMVATLLVANPLTSVPLYFIAYRVGATLLGATPGDFHFELSWDWLLSGMGGAWKPFLLGSLICSVIGGLTAKYLLELIWRVSTVSRLNSRRGNVRNP